MLALGDHSTAQLVANQAKATAHYFMVKLQVVIPRLVLRDLQHSHLVLPALEAVEETPNCLRECGKGILRLHSSRNLNS